MCRIARSREWATRVLHEADSHDGKYCFVTLTYSDIYCPPGGTLRKSALQRYFKRLRKSLEGTDRKIKYFACGEYGDTTSRPHYHAIIFGLGLNPQDQTLIREKWPFGHVKIGTLTYDSARYVADYIFKKYDDIKHNITYGDREKPFHIVSQGLGLQYALENKDQIIQQMGVTVRGVPTGLPRYYRKKLEIDSKEYAESRIEFQKNYTEYMKPNEEASEALQRMRENARRKVAEIKARGNMYKKDKI